MKKLVTLIVAAISALAMCLSFTACGKPTDSSDLKKVKDAGKLVVGVTLYEPMDYLNGDGEWTGFDAELAQEPCCLAAEQVENLLHVQAAVLSLMMGGGA